MKTFFEFSFGFRGDGLKSDVLAGQSHDLDLVRVGKNGLAEKGGEGLSSVATEEAGVIVGGLFMSLKLELYNEAVCGHGSFGSINGHETRRQIVEGRARKMGRITRRGIERNGHGRSFGRKIGVGEGTAIYLAFPKSRV